MKKKLLTMLLMASLFACTKENVSINPKNTSYSEVSNQEVSSDASPSKEPSAKKTKILSKSLINSISNEGRYLIFLNRDVYEQTIRFDQPDQDESVFLNLFSSLGHTSYFDYLETNNLLDNDGLLFDEFMMELLSEDRTVQIGEYIIFVDMVNERVRAIHESNMELYDAMLGETVNDTRILVFSTEVDVLDELATITDPVIGDQTPNGLFKKCKESKAVALEQYTDLVEFSTATEQNVSFRGQLKYERGGIYCSMYIKGRKDDEFSSTQMWIQYPLIKYKPKCMEERNWTPHPWYSNDNTWDRNVKREIWRSTTRLHKYWIKARIRVEDPSSTSGNNPYTTYFTNYEEIRAGY